MQRRGACGRRSEATTSDSLIGSMLSLCSSSPPSPPPSLSSLVIPLHLSSLTAHGRLGQERYKVHGEHGAHANTDEDKRSQESPHWPEGLEEQDSAEGPNSSHGWDHTGAVDGPGEVDPGNVRKIDTEVETWARSEERAAVRSETMNRMVFGIMVEGRLLSLRSSPPPSLRLTYNSVDTKASKCKIKVQTMNIG